MLLPGDPHRALAVAQAILDEPRMFNHTRGLWGYTGRARDGELLTVQATGMGAPSAAIVVQELIDLGARTLVRIGTCGALDDGLELGALVSAEHALAADGTSRALGAGERVPADPELAAALRGAGAEPVTAVTTDLFYDGGDAAGGVGGRRARGWSRWRRRRVLAVAARQRRARGRAAGGDRPAGRRWPRPDRAARSYEQLGVRLGEAAWEALAR